MRIYYSVNSQIFEATVNINTITESTEIIKFSEVGDDEDIAELDMISDIAYGYLPLVDFSTDDNIDFIKSYLSKHYSFIDNSILQSVDVLELCNGRSNYRLYFKIGQRIEKINLFYEPKFKRVLHIRGGNFEIGGSYRTLHPDEYMSDIYFRNVDKQCKESHTELAEGTVVTNIEVKDESDALTYRIIYNVNGKAYRVVMVASK